MAVADEIIVVALRIIAAQLFVEFAAGFAPLGLAVGTRAPMERYDLDVVSRKLDDLSNLLLECTVLLPPRLAHILRNPSPCAVNGDDLDLP